MNRRLALAAIAAFALAAPAFGQAKTHKIAIHMSEGNAARGRVEAMLEGEKDLAFFACENTRQGVRKREGKDVPLIEAVQSGVTRLAELQEQGWSDLRP